MTDPKDTPATLEPCPFCGAPAEFGIVTEGGEANPDFGGHFVQCTNERCHGCMGLRFACGDDPKPALLEAWNTRSGQLVPVPSVEVAAKDAEIAQLKYELRQIKPYAEPEVQRLQKAMDCGWQIPANPPGKDELLGLADAFLAAMKGEGRGDG